MSFGQGFGGNHGGGYGFGGAAEGAQYATNGYNSYSQPTGGYMPASQTNDESRYGTTESLQPLTVKQVLAASVDPSDDTKLSVNGIRLDQLTLVARIVAADVQVTTITLTIDDCTGVIQGTYMVPPEDEMASNEMAVQKRAWIKTGAWLRLVAAVSVQGATRSLTVYRIRSVSDFNELLYHRLQVVKTFLIHTRSKPAAGATGAPSAAYQPNNTALQSDANFGNAATVDDGLAMNPLQRVVYEYVKSNKDAAQRGVTVEEVTRQAAAAHGASAATVKEILDGFASDGHMYTTIDENHYAFCRL